MKKMRLKLSLVGTVIGSLLVFQAQAAFVDEDNKKCADLLSGVARPAAVTDSRKTTSDAWAESVSALKQIEQRVYGRGQVIEALTTAILAKEFVWINVSTSSDPVATPSPFMAS